MHSLKLPLNDINYSTVNYHGGRNLITVMGANNQRLINYVLTHNWFLDNQNPLVTFLKNLSLDINQPDEYLYNTIASKCYHIASLCNITSIYNKGRTFNKILFPEKEHETLLVIPFSKSQYDYRYYFNKDIKVLKPLTTLYTTDTRIRYSTNRMTDNVNSAKKDFSIVQIDPYALAIGYVRYCRSRIADENPSALTPNFYLSTLPLATFYIQHNNYILLNLLHNSNFEIDETKWAQVNIKNELLNYLKFQNYTLNNITFKSISHYIRQLNAIPKEFQTYDNITPANGLSSSFIQLSWIYNYGPMQISIMYLEKIKSVGLIDSAYKNYLKNFLNYNLSTLSNLIPNKLWAEQFDNLFLRLKNLT